MADPQQARGPRWLKWVGLQEPETAPDPEAWAPVASNLEVDDADTGQCEEASRVMGALAAAGVESHRRPYVLQDDIGMGRAGLRLFGPGPQPADRIRMAVVVHNRDLARAREVLANVDDPPKKPDPPANTQSSAS